MTDYESINRAPGAMSQDDRIGEFRHALVNLEDLNPQGADSRYTAGAKVWAQALGSPVVRDLCIDVLEARSHIKQEPFLNIVELWMRASNEAAQPFKDDIGWPQNFNQTEPWLDLVHEITDPNGDSLGEFMVRAVSGTVQGNVPKRAYFPAMVAMLYKHRFGSDALVADVGACMNHTLNALMMPRNILKNMQVSRGNSTSFEERQLRLLMDNIEESRPTFGTGTGYEIENMLDSDTTAWDPKAKLWVKINTIRPDEEIEQPDLVEEYDEVDNFMSDDVRFVRADFTKDPREFVPQLGDDGHDIVNNSAMIYQHQSHPDVVKRILQNCRAVGNRWAVIDVLDFAKPDPKNPQKLRYFKQRLPYTFRGMIYDILEPELGFQEVVRFKTGRCNEARPGRDWHRFADQVIRLAS